MKVLLILGYGILDLKNKVYLDYLNACLKVVSDRKPDYVIICGGKTNPSFPEISEAQSINEYLLKKDSLLAERLILEEKSFTTSANLKESSLILAGMQTTSFQITVCCDSARLPKVYIMSCIYFANLLQDSVSEVNAYRNLLKLHTIDKLNVAKSFTLNDGLLCIEGITWNRPKKELARQIDGSINELAMFRFPQLIEEADQLRRIEFGFA